MPKLPEEILRALKSMSNETRLNILVQLATIESASFSDLINSIEIDKALLTFHLKSLTSSGLVEHYYKHEFGEDQYSFYSITEFGSRLLDSLVNSLVPQIIIEPRKGAASSDNYTVVVTGAKTEQEFPPETTATSGAKQEYLVVYTPEKVQT